MAKPKSMVKKNRDKAENDIPSEDTTFWFCKVPSSLLEAADKKRDSAHASKAGVVVRMLKWYLQVEVEA